MTAKAILGLVPMIQASSLALENAKLAKKKKMDVNDIVGGGIKNIVGITLIKEQANLIGSL